MGLRLVRGQVTAASVPAYGHGCQCDVDGLHWQVDPGFRERFPLAYRDWLQRCRAGTIQPGSVVATQERGQTVFTLAVKRGQLDPVDLSALGQAFSTALQHAGDAGISAVGFHRLGTRCTVRARWPQVLTTIEPLAAASPVEAVVFVDAWDEFVDAHPVGAQVRGRIQRAEVSGVFVDLAWPFDGFVDIADWPREHDPRDPRAMVGAQLGFEVRWLDDANRQARLHPAAWQRGDPRPPWWFDQGIR